MRATTHMHVYERALEERGIPTYVLGGRGYWSQQQVADLRNYLAALANPLDGLALYSVLASPLGGLSLDSLVLIAAEARRSGWAPWRIAHATPRPTPALEPGQAERARRVRGAVRGRARAGAADLAGDADRPRGHASGYDREVLALPAGDRRMANVRKLMRMAREYEAEEGRDLRGFIDFVAERDLIAGARGPGAAGGRGPRRRAADDHPPRQGPGVPGGVRGRPRQGRPRGLRGAADHRRRARGHPPGLDGRRLDRRRRARPDQGASRRPRTRRRSAGSSTSRPRAPRSTCPQRRHRSREAPCAGRPPGADAVAVARPGAGPGRRASRSRSTRAAR